MSNGINRVTVGGNLGADPEYKLTQAGMSVLKLRLATNEGHYDKDHKLVTRTDWHDVVLFGPRAEGLSRVLEKGDSIVVDGALRTSVYERDGKSIKRTEILARELMLSGKRRRTVVDSTALPELEDDPFAEGFDADTSPQHATA